MLATKYERIHQIKQEKLENFYIPRTASQNNSAINNQLAKALSASVYYNGCHF